MDLQLLHKKIMEHCRNAGYSQKALANELGLHTSTLSRKFNPETTTNLLTHNEIKQIVQILAQWQAIYTREQAAELLTLGGLSLSSVNWEVAPFNLLEADQEPLKTAKAKSRTEIEASPKPTRPAERDFFRPASVKAVWTEVGPADSATLHNLPTYATPLVGRQAEVNQLKNIVLHNNTHLLTLTGPGGIGKTRLAAQVGYRLLDHFEQGVCFVELAALHEVAEIPTAIARACGLSEIEGKAKKDTTEQLKSYLANRKQLLILDNFEQLTTTHEAALLLSRLIAAAPGVKFLVTSRNLLKIYGEYEYRVLPLGLPPERSAVNLDELLEQDAISLFLQRAQAANSRFSLSEENSSFIVQICRRLDGIPLALELAAARLRLFPPKLLLEKLNSSFGLLSGGAQDMPGRHQAVRTTIEWSYRLLTPPEKVFFRRLAIFENGATLEAISSILDFSLLLELSPTQKEADAEVVESLELDTLEAVSSLVEKSILQQIETFSDNGTEPNGQTELEMRFVLLEMVREFAREELQKAPAAELDLLKQRHAAYYTQMAQTAAPELRKSRQDFWLARLSHDYPNLQAALQWATASAEPETELAVRLSGALISFWQIRGRFSEGLQWVETVLGCAEHPQSLALGKLLASAARLYLTRRNFEVAESYLQRALDIAQSFNNSDLLGQVYLLQAVTQAYYQKDFTFCRQLLEQSLGYSRQTKNFTQTEGALNQLCQIEIKCSNYRTAAELAEQLHQLSRKTGDKFALFDALYLKSEIAYYMGDYPAVYRLGKEGLALLRHTPDRLKQLKSQVMVGLASEEQGKYSEARFYYETARDVYDELGSLRNHLGMQHNLVHLELVAGNFEAAVEQFKPIVVRWEEIKDNLGMAEALFRLAEATFYQGNLTTARHYCEHSMRLYRQSASKKGIVDNLWQLGKIEKAQGNYSAAEQLLNEGLQIGAPLNLLANEAQLLSEIGQLFRITGEYSQADQPLQKALALFRKIANPKGEIGCLVSLGELEIAQNNFEAATTYLQAGLQLATQLASKVLVAPLLQQLAHLKLKQAKASSAANPAQTQSYYSQTKSYLGESLAICAELNLQIKLPEILVVTISLLTGLGQTESAAKIVGYCQALLERQTAQLEQYPYRAEYEILLAELARQLSEDFNSFLAQGRHLTLPQIGQLLR